jgi:hypothetical protein
MKRNTVFLCILSCAFILLSLACTPPDDGTKTVTLYSVASMDGSSIWTSPGTYSGSATDVSVNIGDDASDTNYTRCFVSFDLSSIPDGSDIVSASLKVFQNSDSQGDSYALSVNGGLEDVLVDNVTYDTFTPDTAFWTVIGQDIGTLSSSFSPNTWHTLDVLVQATDEMTQLHHRKLQFRIYHHYENNNNSTADTDGWVMGDSSTNRPELVIKYK